MQINILCRGACSLFLSVLSITWLLLGGTLASDDKEKIPEREKELELHQTPAFNSQIPEIPTTIANEILAYLPTKKDISLEILRTLYPGDITNQPDFQTLKHCNPDKILLPTPLIQELQEKCRSEENKEDDEKLYQLRCVRVKFRKSLLDFFEHYNAINAPTNSTKKPHNKKIPGEYPYQTPPSLSNVLREIIVKTVSSEIERHYFATIVEFKVHSSRCLQGAMRANEEAAILGSAQSIYSSGSTLSSPPSSQPSSYLRSAMDMMGWFMPSGDVQDSSPLTPEFDVDQIEAEIPGHIRDSMSKRSSSMRGYKCNKRHSEARGYHHEASMDNVGCYWRNLWPSESALVIPAHAHILSLIQEGKIPEKVSKAHAATIAQIKEIVNSKSNPKHILHRFIHTNIVYNVGELKQVIQAHEKGQLQLHNDFELRDDLDRYMDALTTLRRLWTSLLEKNEQIKEEHQNFIIALQEYIYNLNEGQPLKALAEEAHLDLTQNLESLVDQYLKSMEEEEVNSEESHDTESQPKEDSGPVPHLPWQKQAYQLIKELKDIGVILTKDDEKAIEKVAKKLSIFLFNQEKHVQEKTRKYLYKQLWAKFKEEFQSSGTKPNFSLPKTRKHQLVKFKEQFNPLSINTLILKGSHFDEEILHYFDPLMLSKMPLTHLTLDFDTFDEGSTVNFFAGLTSDLISLTICGNLGNSIMAQMQKSPEILKHLGTLQELTVSFKGQLHEDGLYNYALRLLIGFMPELNKLTIQDNPSIVLSVVANDLKFLRCLTHLRLQNIQMDRPALHYLIESVLPSLTKLEELDLSRNPLLPRTSIDFLRSRHNLRVLPEPEESLEKEASTSLLDDEGKTLSLTYRDSTFVPLLDPLRERSMSNLRTFSLTGDKFDGNLCESTSDLFSQMTNLENLILTFDQFELYVLLEYFNYLPKHSLKSLTVGPNLTYKGLEDLTTSGKLGSLQTLTLLALKDKHTQPCNCHKYVETLNALLSQTPTLTYLDLSNNAHLELELNTLGRTLRTFTPQLNGINFSNGPIQGDQLKLFLQAFCSGLTFFKSEKLPFEDVPLVCVTSTDLQAGAALPEKVVIDVTGNPIHVSFYKTIEDTFPRVSIIWPETHSVGEE